MTILELHKVLFDKLLAFHNKHNDFTYWVRQNWADNFNKIISGLYFNSDGKNYIFVGLTKIGARNTGRTLNLHFSLTKTNDIQIVLNYDLRNKTNKNVLDCHYEIIKLFNIHVNNNSNKQDNIAIPNFPSIQISELDKFLEDFYTNYWTKILEIVEKHKLSDEIIISEGDFKSSIKYIEEIVNNSNKNKEETKFIKSSFEEYIQNLDKDDLRYYLDYLAHLLNYFDIKKGDVRIHLNYNMQNRNSLVFNIGQRYCWFYDEKRKTGKFGIISKEKFSDNVGEFKITNDKLKTPVYFNHYNDRRDLKSYEEKIYEAINNELKSTNISGYRKFHKKDFEDYIYDIVMKDDDYSLNIREDSTINKVNNKLCNFPLNQVFYGPPGTGKTRKTVQNAVKILDCLDVDPEYDIDLIDKYNNYKKEGRLAFVTFHQNFSYEDFIQGIKPVLNEQMKFDLEDGIFKEMADKAKKDLENKYVIIIDEINRANVSRVFGELITLIEPDKRWNEKEGQIDWSVKLPSGKDFVVPDNLYIIGTMNTADKSIALLDVALRRRFVFEAMYPLYNSSIPYRNPAYSDYLKKLNDLIVAKIGAGRGHDLQIGHSYFMDLDSKDDFIKNMNDKVIPLLMEYFMNNVEDVKTILTKSLEVQIDNDTFEIIKDQFPIKIKVMESSNPTQTKDSPENSEGDIQVEENK